MHFIAVHLMDFLEDSIHNRVGVLLNQRAGYRFAYDLPFDFHMHDFIAQLMRKIHRAVSREIPGGYSREEQGIL